MASIEFSEDFEGGTNGSAITNANTGFDFFSGTGTSTFDNSTAATGSQSAKYVTSASLRYVQHTFTGSRSVLYVRFAMFLPALFSANTVVCTIASTGVSAELRINTAGTLTMRNNTIAVATTTNNLPIGSWFVIEWNVNNNTSSQSARLYSSVRGTPLETISGLYNQGALIDVTIGPSTSATGTVWIDSFANATDTWVGPLSDEPGVAWLS